MKASALILLEIPQGLWNNIPGDRPFAALAADALASERRIRKSVNLARERSRYTQLCNWIELSALQLFHKADIANSLVLTDAAHTQEAADYLRLVELLQMHPDIGAHLRDHFRPTDGGWAASKRPLIGRIFSTIFGWNKKSEHEPVRSMEKTSTRPQPIGKSFYPPGDPVAEQCAIFDEVSLDGLHSLTPGTPRHALAAYFELARQKSKFYRAAHQRKSAVVEVLNLYDDLLERGYGFTKKGERTPALDALDNARQCWPSSGTTTPQPAGVFRSVATSEDSMPAISMPPMTAPPRMQRAPLLRIRPAGTLDWQLVEYFPAGAKPIRLGRDKFTGLMPWPVLQRLKDNGLLVGVQKKRVKLRSSRCRAFRLCL